MRDSSWYTQVDRDIGRLDGTTEYNRAMLGRLGEKQTALSGEVSANTERSTRNARLHEEKGLNGRWLLQQDPKRLLAYVFALVVAILALTGMVVIIARYAPIVWVIVQEGLR